MDYRDWLLRFSKTAHVHRSYLHFSACACSLTYDIYIFTRRQCYRNCGKDFFPDGNANLVLSRINPKRHRATIGDRDYFHSID